MADNTGLGAPDKVVVIDTPNKTLDKLAGKTEEQQVVVEDQPTGDAGDEQQNAIRTIPEETEEAEVTSTSDDTTTDEGGDPSKEVKTDPVVNTEEPEINLDELEVEIEDGTTRSVNELLDERDTLAKRVAEIEGDAFLKGLIEHYKATGRIDEYYEAKAVDWDKKKDLEVLKISFDKENSDLPEKTRELKWKRKLRNDYMIKDDLTPEELESEDYLIAQGELERDARKVREQFKANQQKYKVPEKTVEQPPKQTQQYDPVAHKKKLLQEKEVSTFAKNKLLPLGVKDGTGKTLGFEPKNTDQIIEMMTDDKKFWSVFIDQKTGKVNYTKLAKAYAYAQDPDFYEQSLVNLGKNLHLEDRIKDQKQIDDRLSRTKQAPPAKTSFSKGFLTEALKQRKK